MIEWVLFNYWPFAVFTGLVLSTVGAYFMTTEDFWLGDDGEPFFLAIFALVALGAVVWPAAIPIGIGAAIGLAVNNHRKTKAEKLEAEKKRQAEVTYVLKQEGLPHD